MQKRKKIILIIILVIVAMIVAAVCVKVKKPMLWAQNLKADEVSKMEVSVSPPQGEYRYRLYTQDELEGVVEIINQCEGRVTFLPKNPVGGGFCMYIRTEDGTLHTVANNGMEIIIDGTYYRGEKEWLNQWMDSIEANSASPSEYYDK